MEEFLKLDWTPRTEDILVGRYVEEDRLKNEGATNKILLGSFSNPFADVRTQKKVRGEEPEGSITPNTQAALGSDVGISFPTDKK